MIDRIGKIVRTVREQEGSSLEALEGRSGVPVSVLAALEAGQRGITTGQLDEVARALSLDAAALLNGREVRRPVPSVFLRHVAFQDFDVDRDGANLDDALEQGRSLASLQALLRRAPLALQANVFSPREAAADRPDAPAQDGYQLARSVRAWLGNVAEPLGDVRILVEERFGVAVVARALESSRVTAVAVRAGTCGAVVLSSRDVHRARNPLLARVHLSHELCHVLFDPSPGGLHIIADSTSDKKINAAERRARAFAAELLLPLEGLTRLLGSPREVDAPSSARQLVAQARSRFGAPHELSANHLCNHGFIDLRLREWLEAERTTFDGGPPPTTVPPTGASSIYLGELVKQAHQDGLLTDGEARETLGIERLAPLPWEEPEL